MALEAARTRAGTASDLGVVAAELRYVCVLIGDTFPAIIERMQAVADPWDESDRGGRKRTAAAGARVFDPQPRDESDRGGRKRAAPGREHAIAALARRQHGIVTLTQLGELGLGARGAQKRVVAGRLHRVHQGVYALWPAVGLEGQWFAAVLACGPCAALSHHAAASAHGFRRHRRGWVDVISPTGAGRRRDGIRVHAPADVRAEDVTLVRGIRCTTVARTLFDLAAVLDRRGLERAFDEAEILRVLDARPLRALIDRSRQGSRAAARLRTILDEHDAGSTVTRSELEETLLARCSATEIPRPEINGWVELPGGGVEVDALWRSHKLAVEVDGRETHLTGHAFESDRRRDQRLVLAGYRVVRFTWKQITFESPDVARTIGALVGETRAGVA